MIVKKAIKQKQSGGGVTNITYNVEGLDPSKYYTKEEVDALIANLGGGEESVIESVEAFESPQSGGVSLVTITLTNGEQQVIHVYNGVDGDSGVELGQVAIAQSTGDDSTKVMSQEATTNAICKDVKVCECVHFGNATTSYFDLTNKQVQVLNASDVISIRFVAKPKGNQSSPWRYFCLAGSDGATANASGERDYTSGFNLRCDYSRRMFAAGVNYNTATCINKLNDAPITPAVFTVVWDRVNGIVKYYEKYTKLTEQQDSAYILSNFIGSKKRLTFISSDVDTLLYDLQIYDGDIGTALENNFGGTRTEELASFGACYVNAIYDQNFANGGEWLSGAVSTYGGNTSFQITSAANNPDGYVHVRSTTAATSASTAATGYYVGLSNKAIYYESDVEVVSGQVKFGRQSANASPVVIVDSQSNEYADGSTVGVGEYTLKGSGASTGKYKITYVSGDVDVIRKADRYKLISCCVHIKGNMLVKDGHTFYDEQADTFYQVANAAPDGSKFDTVENTIANRPPLFVGQRAVVGTNIYISNGNFQWTKVN